MKTNIPTKINTQITFNIINNLIKQRNKLLKYAQHKPDCNLQLLIPCKSCNGKPVGCTCGLDKLKAQIKNKKEK